MSLTVLSVSSHLIWFGLINSECVSFELGQVPSASFDGAVMTGLPWKQPIKRRECQHERTRFNDDSWIDLSKYWWKLKWDCIKHKNFLLLHYCFAIVWNSSPMCPPGFDQERQQTFLQTKNGSFRTRHTFLTALHTAHGDIFSTEREKRYLKMTMYWLPVSDFIYATDWIIDSLSGSKRGRTRRETRGLLK